MYANSQASELLRKDHPHTHRDLVLHMGDESYWGWGKVGGRARGGAGRT